MYSGVAIQLKKLLYGGCPTAILFLIAAVLLAFGAHAQDRAGARRSLTVAAAADLTDCLKPIAAGFEKQSGARVSLIFGSSGNLASQIENGAPYDIFLSADSDYPARLAREGSADPTSVQTYAVGSLAVLLPVGSRADIRRIGLSALLDPAIRRVAIANPAHAPYGRAAQALLQGAGLYGRLLPKLVLGENVAQTAQFVVTGNANAGIVSLAQAISAASSGKFTYWEPAAKYPPIKQAAVVTARARDPQLARMFLRYLRSPESVAIFTRYGFRQPDGVAPRTVAPSQGASRGRSR